MIGGRALRGPFFLVLMVGGRQYAGAAWGRRFPFAIRTLVALAEAAKAIDNQRKKRWETLTP
jgi:hypothetical protein